MPFTHESHGPYASHGPYLAISWTSHTHASRLLYLSHILYLSWTSCAYARLRATDLTPVSIERPRPVLYRSRCIFTIRCSTTVICTLLSNAFCFLGCGVGFSHPLYGRLKRADEERERGGGVGPIWECGSLSRGLWLSYLSRSYRNSAEFNPKAAVQ
jgi:hypothetical protein